jgi:hypothetical protein
MAAGGPAYSLKFNPKPELAHSQLAAHGVPCFRSDKIGTTGGCHRFAASNDRETGKIGQCVAKKMVFP